MTPGPLQPRSPQPPPAPAGKPALWRPLMSENPDFKNAVIPLLVRYGFLVHHSLPAPTKDSARWVTALQGHPGLPDLVFAKGGTVWMVELKRDDKNPTAEQRAWLAAAGRLAAVWRPRDLPWVREWAKHPFEAAA